jgi:2-methylisocitrate lyase-like PEP mutase family enzyme
VSLSRHATDSVAFGSEFIVCARTDARSVEGLEAVVERAKLYVDAGADMIFPEGLHTAEGQIPLRIKC